MAGASRSVVWPLKASAGGELGERSAFCVLRSDSVLTTRELFIARKDRKKMFWFLARNLVGPILISPPRRTHTSLFGVCIFPCTRSTTSMRCRYPL